MLRSSLYAAPIVAIVLFACGSQSGVVGGQCATGYRPCGHTCCVSPLNDATSDDGSNDDGGSGDGSNGGDTGNDGNGDGGPDPDAAADSGSCVPPEILCGPICLDPTSDPLNCGKCGKVCPSNSCVNGVCQGSAPGHLVAIGHDYQTAPQQASSQARVLTNAMLLPSSNPLRVLSYERYSDQTAVSNVKTLVTAAAMKLGRSVAFTVVTQDNQVPAMLDITAFDVFFVPDQIGASQGDLSSLGGAWKQTTKLDDFEKAGGVMVALDGASGIGEMPGFLSATGLLAVSAHMSLTNPSLTVIAPNDAVGSGVVSPYVPTSRTAMMSTEANGGNVTYVVVKPQSLPAVVHKVFP